MCAFDSHQGYVPKDDGSYSEAERERILREERERQKRIAQEEAERVAKGKRKDTEPR